MKKIVMSGISLLVLGASNNASALLASNATLLFDDATYDTNGNVNGGAFFSWGTALSPRIGIVGEKGITIGTAQPASGSHGGAPTGFESFNIDKPWLFNGNTGMHLTTPPVTIASDDTVGNVLLDMSGWAITWNGIANIPLGTGSWGTNLDGMAQLTCFFDCSVGETFSLYYTATVPIGDPSGLGGTQYQLGGDGSSAEVLEEQSAAASPILFTGTIGPGAVVPVPAAVWLFGSGMLVLAGVARRRV